MKVKEIMTPNPKAVWLTEGGQLVDQALSVNYESH